MIGYVIIFSWLINLLIDWLVFVWLIDFWLTGQLQSMCLTGTALVAGADSHSAAGIATMASRVSALSCFHMGSLLEPYTSISQPTVIRGEATDCCRCSQRHRRGTFLWWSSTMHLRLLRQVVLLGWMLCRVLSVLSDGIQRNKKWFIKYQYHWLEH